MAKFAKKLNPLVSRQLPEHIQANSPLLVDFIKQYYEFMDSAQITLSSVTASDQVLLETETEGHLAMDATDEHGSDEGDFLLSEQGTVGEFTKGETITGGTSGETATILAEDTDNLKIWISANSKFITGEIITGSTSGGSGIVGKYRANPNEVLTQLLEYADVNDSLDDFFTSFRNAFLQTIPNDLDDNVNKRQLTKNILSLYKRKGTKKGHQIFFRALLNEEAELYYPTVDMLRVSDGKWTTTKIIRATLLTPTTGDMTRLTSQTVTQDNVIADANINLATAVVDSVSVSNINISGTQTSVGTFVLNNVTGTFVDGQTFYATDNEDSSVRITCTIGSIMDDITVTSPGRYYTVGETVAISGGGGDGASAQVEDTSYGSIENIIVETPGTGYVVGDTLSVTNPTYGSGLAGRVEVVNGGFRLEADSLEEGRIIIEDTTDDMVVMEDATNSSLGDVVKVLITNSGYGYASLPTVTISTSTGTGAGVFPVSSGVGKVLSVKNVDQGFSYETAPTLSPRLHMQIDTLSANFTDGETISATAEDNIILESADALDGDISLEDYRHPRFRQEDGYGDIELEDDTGVLEVEENITEGVLELGPGRIITEDGDVLIHSYYAHTDEVDFLIVTHDGTTESRLQHETSGSVSGTLESFVGATNIMTLTSPTGTFDDKVTITGGTSSTTARVRNADKAIMTSTNGTVITTDGAYTGVDGQISESTKKIQDSLYYQDYSYVVRVGESIAGWRDYLKSAVHPAGFYVVGEVSIRTLLDAKMKVGFVRTSGVVEPDEVVEIYTVIFGEKIGRRLGTTSDGTTQRTNAERGIEFAASYTSNTRDVTLTTERTLNLGPRSSPKTVQGVDVIQGFVYGGPRYSAINRFASTAFDHTPDKLLMDASDGSSTDEKDDIILEDILNNGEIKQELGLRDMDSGVTLVILNNVLITGTGKTPPNGETPTFATFNSDLKTNFAIPAQINTSYA